MVYAVSVVERLSFWELQIAEKKDFSAGKEIFSLGT